MPRLARWTFPLVVCGVLAAAGSWSWLTAPSHAAPTNPAPVEKKAVEKKPVEKKPTDKKAADKTPVVPNSAQPAKGFKLLPGFQAELLYTVPKNRQGSWVNLAVDPQGRLITSDQNGKLFRITPPPIGDHHTATFVEALDVNIGDAQGLLCAFGNLYVVVNGRAAQGSGLYRVRDTKHDGHYDEVTLLRRLDGNSEHGPHGVVVAPDGKSLLVVCGNFTNLPQLDKSAMPRCWGEDHLIGRQPDARGFATGRMAPGGWIGRIDPDGKKVELYSGGYRNAFDLAVNPDGEVFTFDSDMEWDVGLPWYRPTRINHVTSGSEYGWRYGSGKWPAYYADSLPAVVDIGPGSPTGLTFGTGAKFPARYQKALFACDWSYGQLYAVHLTPQGSSYSATFETFATAAPLPLTDAVVRPQDGALYFTVGGRRTDSALYRIFYTGNESTAAVTPAPDAGAAAREERHKLEALHYAGAPGAIDTAWPYLGSDDRFLRFAARVAIEHQDTAQWVDRALKETNPQASITAMVALARRGGKQRGPQIIEALGRIDYDKLTDPQRLELLRAYGLTFLRQGRPDEAGRKAVLAKIDAHYPANTMEMNRQLGETLIYLEAPGVVERTLKLLAAAPTQEEQIEYVFALRNLRSGWTQEQRKAYFEWFLSAAKHNGGASFEGYLANIRNEALGATAPADKTALKALLDKRPNRRDPAAAGPPRKFVKNWTTAEVVKAVEAAPPGRDFARGQATLGAASCLRCHRFRGEGGIMAPDLTMVGHRFSVRDVVESIVEPSKVVSDQYQATIFDLKNGTTVIGRVANLNGDSLNVVTNMLDPEHFTDVHRGNIEEMRPSPTSMMPNGLLDTFSEEEIVDLVAYLRAGGNSSDPVFQRPKATAAK